MTDAAWSLDGIAPHLRDRAVKEAARRGVSLADYLADVVLRHAAASPPGPHKGSAGPNDLEAEINAVRSRLANVEIAGAARSEANEAAHAELGEACARLSQRLEAAEAAAAETRTDIETAVRGDVVALANDLAAKLNAGLEEVRAAAESASRQADAAAAHVVSELRGVRETLESRLVESLEESRARMRGEFAAALEHTAALAERVTTAEQAQTRGLERLSAQIIEVEDAARSALERSADALRDADAALAAEVARARQDAREAVVAAGFETSARIEALTARLEETTEAAHESHRALRAETERVEACTLAALEKLSADIAAADAERRHAQHAAEERLERLGRRMDGDLDGLWNGQAETSARLDLLNGAVTALVAGVTPSNERLARLEEDSARAAALQLARRVAELEERQAHAFDALRADIVRFIGDNLQRLAALEAGVATLEPDAAVRQFAALRQRVEERIASVEQRSVRMLEQVADTVALLDKRLGGGAAEHVLAKSA